MSIIFINTYILYGINIQRRHQIVSQQMNPEPNATITTAFF